MRRNFFPPRKMAKTKKAKTKKAHMKRPTINVGNYGYETTVTKTRRRLRSPPPPGEPAIRWYTNKSIREAFHRFHPRWKYDPKVEHIEEESPGGNFSPGFRPTRKNKKKKINNVPIRNLYMYL